MKKILTTAAVLVAAALFTVNAAAMYSFDRLFVNEYALASGTDRQTEDPVTIQPGDKIYILGWSTIEGGLKEIVYTVDGGEQHTVENNYRDRADLTGAPYSAANNGAHAGFGTDERAMELTGIDSLTDGTYVISVIAISENGTSETVKTFNLKVGEGAAADTGEQNTGTEQNGQNNAQTQNPGTSDAPVIAIVTVSLLSLSGLTLLKKRK